MATTTLQKRGVLTVPQADRTALGWSEGQLLITTVVSPDSLYIRAVPDAETLFARYAPSVDAAVDVGAAPPTTGMWLPPAALWHAQTEPSSPWRPIWQAISRGMTTRRTDPTTLAAWAEQVGRMFPHVTRSDQARYLQSVCAWPGLDLPDRPFWLTVWDAWGQTEADWSDVVWHVRNATDTLSTDPSAGEPS
ncbi:MAG: hypothetical protein OWQ57_05535 [Sulfobacillus sp.]|nr:hypothetical protein [Sulfobacillus sp.]